jgi:hypothetical protein
MSDWGVASPRATEPKRRRWGQTCRLEFRGVVAEDREDAVPVHLERSLAQLGAGSGAGVRASCEPTSRKSLDAEHSPIIRLIMLVFHTRHS